MKESDKNSIDLDVVYQQYAKLVYRFLYVHTHDAQWSEELMQETFLRAVTSINRYDGSCKLSVWLCQISKHLWYQWLDKHSRRKQVELTDEIPGRESPENSACLHMEKTALYKAIHCLPEPMREVVHMRLTGEFSFSEIGEILGKSENWARTTFYRAKQKIIEEMEGA